MHVLVARVLGYGRGVGLLRGVAVVDLMGERLLLGGGGRHLHGHVVRLLRHLRVVHDLRVAGVGVAHLRGHRGRVARGIHGGWRLELGLRVLGSWELGELG